MCPIKLLTNKFSITVQRSRVGRPWRRRRVRGPNRIWLVQRCRNGSDEQIWRPANNRFDRINHLFSIWNSGGQGYACVWGCALNETVFSTFRLFQLYFLCIDSEHCNIWLQNRGLFLVTRHTTLDEIATINWEISAAKIETILQ